MAQRRQITGKVVSAEDGTGIPGVNVVVKGTANGTTTDAEGKYSLEASKGDVIVFSFTGLTTREIGVADQTIIDVAMAEDTKQLGEVVVVGYGTQEKRDITGNIAQVSGAAIQNVPVTTIEQSLQGKAAGVFIEAQNGKLGQGIKVRVRGASSLSASNQPLYVIDGIPITTASQSSNGAETNPMADLNFNDVASMEVLKDASAAAIYGSRAANGVILITTKRGKSGKTNFSINYTTGVSKETGRREFLNSQQYVDVENQAAANAAALDPSFDYVAFNTSRLTRYAAGSSNFLTYNTDWQNLVLRSAPFNQLDVSASGGNDKTRFFASGQYSDQNGILIGNNFKRLTGRLNLDHKATEKFSFGLNFNFSRTENHRVSNDDAFSTPLQIVALSPITPEIDPRTNLISGLLNNATGAPNTNYPVYYNPMISVSNASFVATVYRNWSNAYASYNIIPGLTFRSEFGADILFQTEDQYLGSATVRNTGTPNGEGLNTTALIVNYTTNNFLKFDKTIGDHTFDITGGMSFQKSRSDAAFIRAQQFPSDAYKSISGAAQIIQASAGPNNFAFLSYFARGNYKFKDRYLLSLSGRVDGSSRFGANNRYGFFPAASVGWIISEESFMQNLTFLSNLKLRASYGLTGNAEISNFASRGLYAPAPYVGSGGQVPLQLQNPNLKWETTAQMDIGLDFSFLKDRISVEVDYYEKKTSDLLLARPVIGSSGFSSYIQNIGKLENKGVEFVVNSTNLVKSDFQWKTSFNLSHTTNKITYLDGQILGTNDLNRAMEGQPIGVFYGREFAGADPNNGDAVYFLNTKNGDGTINRNTTNDYNAAQQVVLGNPNPQWYGGITNTLTYKGFELSVLFQGVIDYKIYNFGGQYMSASASNGYDNQTTDQLRAWKKPGDITDVPQLRLFFGNGVNPSNRYLSDGTYVRLKTVTLGYNLPASVTSRLKLEKLRVYFTGQNLATFTSYKGWDPEVNADFQASSINQSNDFYSAPQPKTFTFGINIGF